MLKKNIYSTHEKKWTNEEMVMLMHFGVNQFITLYKRFLTQRPSIVREESAEYSTPHGVGCRKAGECNERALRSF